MKIRRGKSTDLGKLMKFLNSAAELQSGVEGPTYDKSFVRACLTDRNRDLVLIAEEKGKIIGFLMAELWQKKRNSFLLDLYVEPEYRKQGIATKLREAHERICKKLKIQRIHCLVLSTNERMQDYIEKRGYSRGDSFYFYEKRLES